MTTVPTDTPTDVSLFLSLNVGDTLRRTTHLEEAPMGACFRLILAAWPRGGRLPKANVRRLAGVLDDTLWAMIWPAIADLWPDADCGQYVYWPGMPEAHARAQKARAAAAARGKSRWEKHRDQQGDGLNDEHRDQQGDGQEPQDSGLRTPISGSPNTEHRTPDPEVGAEAPADGHSPPAAAGVSLLDFGTRGKIRIWSLTQPEADRLAEAFPDLEIVACAKKAKAWIAANPERTPTARGMSAFLYRWISREQNGRPNLRVLPGRDVRIGHTYAEDFKHSAKTGPVDL